VQIRSTLDQEVNVGTASDMRSLIREPSTWRGWIVAALLGLGAIVAVTRGIETDPDCSPIAVRYEPTNGTRDAGRWGAIAVHVCGILPLTHSAVAIRYELDVRLTLVAP
jgi:hypothetical protein